MKNLLRETCQRLKDAGFPQPERAPGQLWYCRKELCVLYRFEAVPDGILAASLEGPSHYGTNAPDDWVYCPTALEIAEQIHWCDISFMGNGMYQVQFGEKKTVHQTNNLAETLAEIWLSENYEPV